MKRARSEALWQYLSDTGALNGTEAEIQAAKKQYRKIYKQQWKKNNNKKELRPQFTPQEFTLLISKAKQAGLKPTVFARQAILQTISKDSIIPKKEVLLQVLQYISIAAIEVSKHHALQDVQEHIEKAEKLLLNYLFNRDS